MTDKPMIFSAPMIRALLDGRKTQTRRVLKPQPPDWTARVAFNPVLGWSAYDDAAPDGRRDAARVPYAPGDRLWAREAWTPTTDGRNVVYRADATDKHGWRWHTITPGDPQREVRWRSPIHMPRWASRLTLHITDVRVQRVQEISLADMDREGWPGVLENKRWTPAEWFIDTWNAINAKRGYGWSTNPWVVALTFEVERANIDAAKGGVMADPAPQGEPA